MKKATVNNFDLFMFLKLHAQKKELNELAKILKCKKHADKVLYAREITKQIYKCYQTPVGYIVKKPTLDHMCDRLAKKLKLRKLEGVGWEKLHSLTVNVFEKLFESMTEEEKEKLLKELWAKLSAEEKKKLKKEFNIADVSSFMHHSELLVAHVIGVHLAREMALYTAAAILRINLGAELTLAASTVLTRTATAFLGPVGWALVLVSINDIMGTNFKRVVPALLTLNIINMRVHEKDNEAFMRFLNKGRSPIFAL